MTLRLLVALAAALAGAGMVRAGDAPPAPDRPLTLAVLNFTNRNPGDGWDWLEKGLADLLITDLSASARLRVVERERMQFLFDELELQKQLGMDASTATRKFGAVAEAKYVLTGTFWVKSGRLAIQSHMTEVPSGKLARLEEVGGAARQALQLEKNLALAIVKKLDVPLTPKERKLLLRLPARSIDAVAEFYRGIDHLDHGRPFDALAVFGQASRGDPTYDEARLRLGQVYAVTSQPEHAAVVYRRLLEGRPGGKMEADALFRLGRLCLDALNRADEAVGCFQRLYQLPGPFKLHTVRAYDLGALGALPAKQFPRLLVAEALERKGDFKTAGRIYAEMHRPFIKSCNFWCGDMDDFGETRWRENVSDLVRKRYQRFLSNAREATGAVPPLHCCMIVLDPKNLAYEEDYRTDKRFTDGSLITSWGRGHFSPKTWLSAPYFTGKGGGVGDDIYHVVVRPGHWVRRLRVGLKSSGRASVTAYAAGLRRTFKQKSHLRTTGSDTFEFPPGVQAFRLSIYPMGGRIYHWKIEATLEPAKPTGSIHVETLPALAEIQMDGECRRFSPLTIRAVAPGQHTLRALLPGPESKRVHHGWLYQFGSWDSGEVKVNVKAGRTTRLSLRLKKVKPGLPGWGVPECAVPDVHEGHAVILPDGSAWAVGARESELWAASSPRPGTWAKPARLPVPINTIAREEMPRCIGTTDGRVLLVWGVRQPKRFAFYSAQRRVTGSWTAPRLVAVSSQIPRGVDLVADSSGSAYLVWSTSKSRSAKHGVSIQKLTGGVPQGKSRLLLTSADLDPNADHVPHLVLRPSGGAALFVAGGVTTSKDMGEWTPLRAVTCVTRSSARRAAWVRPDGATILATCAMVGGSNMPRGFRLHVSRNLERWDKLGVALDHSLWDLRLITQPNRLPALVWRAGNGLWMCRARTDPFVRGKMTAECTTKE